VILILVDNAQKTYRSRKSLGQAHDHSSGFVCLDKFAIWQTSKQIGWAICCRKPKNVVNYKKNNQTDVFAVSLENNLNQYGNISIKLLSKEKMAIGCSNIITSTCFKIPTMLKNKNISKKSFIILPFKFH